MCPANTYCLGGVGAVAVATPCPGTTSTNGATASTNLLQCAQGNTWNLQSDLPSQDWNLIEIAPSTNEAVRYAAGKNGLIYATADSGVTWTVNGPSTTVNRTWTGLATCIARDPALTANRHYVVASASGVDGGIFVGTATAVDAVATNWNKLTGQLNAPADNLAWTDVACADPVFTPGASSALYVLASIGGAAGTLWLGSAVVTSNLVTASGLPTALAWIEQVPVSGALVYADYVSVAAATAGAATNAQAVVFAAAAQGASGKLYNGLTSSAALSTTAPSTAWTLETVVVNTVTQTNFVSVDVADVNSGTPADTSAATVPIAAAIGGSHVVASTQSVTTGWNILSTATAGWTVVDLNLLGSNVIATTGTTIAGATSLTSPGSFKAITITPTTSPLVTQTLSDIALVGTLNAGSVTATSGGFDGNGILAGALAGTGPWTWAAVPQSNAITWLGVVTATTGARSVAWTANTLYVSNDFGSTWLRKFSAGANAINEAACDGSCAVVAVAVVVAGLPDLVYTSTNGGQTFNSGVKLSTDATTSAAVVNSVAVNTEGTIIYAASDTTGGTAADGYIFTAGSTGTPFTIRTSATALDWYTLSAGAGNILAGAVTGGLVYSSTDAGVTMTSTGGPSSSAWIWLVTSADGTKLAVISTSELWVGTCVPGGVCSWTKQTGSGSGPSAVTLPTTTPTFQSIAMTDDGTRLLLGSGATTANDGGIYVGTLSGASYSYAGPKRPTGAQADYEGLAISNNGGYAFAALGATGQQIYAGSGVL